MILLYFNSHCDCKVSHPRAMNMACPCIAVLRNSCSRSLPLLILHARSHGKRRAAQRRKRTTSPKILRASVTILSNLSCVMLLLRGRNIAALMGVLSARRGRSMPNGQRPTTSRAETSILPRSTPTTRPALRVALRSRLRDLRPPIGIPQPRRRTGQMRVGTTTNPNLGRSTWCIWDERAS